ncbi:MAG: ABC transporter permease [Clostridia bacterium]|nr:ABC transporter permease [Clostridia bacterium]
MLVVSAVTFGLVNVAPGGPASMMHMETTAAEREAIVKQLHLDRPVYVRYAIWLAQALRGDFGASLNSRQPVMPLIRERLANTAQLGLSALVLAIAVGVPLGVVSALRRDTWVDHAATVVSTLGMSVPDFWLGILLIMLFSVSLHVLPPSGMATIGEPFSLADRIDHLAMPASVLTLVVLPNIVRFARSSLVEVLSQDYIRTAHAKGVPARAVVSRHALRNALIPVVTILGLLVPALLGGSAIVESVFGWPGMGRLAVEASMNRDYTMIMGVTVVAAAVVVATNLVVDLAYSALDPRIRYD